MRSYHVLFCFLLACSSDDTNTPSVVNDAGPTDATVVDPPNDAGHPHDDAGPVDAGSDSGNTAIRCTKADFDAHDHTGTNGVDITGPLVATPAQYNNNCARVKVGQHVGIYSQFSDHPIEPAGGTTPSFIPATSTGDALNLTAPATTGVYGFQCSSHPDTMWGAVEVVP